MMSRSPRAMEKTDKTTMPLADILAAKNHILQPFFAGKASMIPVGSFLAMGTKSKQKDASFKFMRWLSTEGAAYIKDIPGWKKEAQKFMTEETDKILKKNPKISRYPKKENEGPLSFS